MSQFDRLEEMATATKKYEQWLCGKRFAAKQGEVRPPSARDMAEAWAVALANALSDRDDRMEMP